MIIRWRNSWWCSFTIDSKLIKSSTILNIYFLMLWSICRYNNFSRIFLLTVLLTINNIICSNTCMYDVRLNVSRQIDHEFFLWCLISTDRNLIFIISSWRIVCFQSFRISSAAFRQRISFYSELHLESLYTWNRSDLLTWLDRIKITSSLLLCRLTFVRFVNQFFLLIESFDACANFDRRNHRSMNLRDVWWVSLLYHSSFLINKLF